MLFAAALAISLAVPTVPFPTPEAAAHGVVDAFRADDLARLHALAPANIGDPVEWLSADEVVERLDCISIPFEAIEDVERDREAAIVTVRVAGSGVTSGGLRIARPVPQRWSVRAVPAGGGWAVQSVSSDAANVAAALAALPDDASRRERMLREHELDPAAILVALAGSVTLRQPADAAPLLAFTVAEARALADPELESYCLRALGAQRVRQGMLTEARALAEEALGIAERIGSTDRKADAVTLDAAVSWFSGDRARAAESYALAAGMVDELADTRIAHKARVMEAMMYRRAGNTAGALAAAFVLEEQVQRYPWLEGDLNVQDSLATSLGLLGYESAGAHAQAAYRLARQIRSSDLTSMMANNVALILADRGDYRGAVLLAREALPGARRSMEIAGLYGLIASCLEHLDDEDGAMAAAERALEVVDEERQLKASILTTMSRVHRRAGRLDKALEIARQAVDAAAEEGRNRSTSVPDRWEPKTEEAEALRALGRTGEAADAYRSAIDLTESQRVGTAGAEARTRYLSGRVAPYFGLMSLLLADGRHGDALRISELLKGRGLRDMYATGSSIAGEALAPAAEEKAASVEHEVVRLNTLYVKEARSPRRREIAAALSTAREELDVLRSSSRSKIAAGTAAEGEDVLSKPRVLLPSERDAILDYVVGDEETTLFIITRKGDELQIDVQRIAVSRHELERQVTALTGMLETRNLGYGLVARKLYRLLLARAEERIGGRRVIAVIPDGPLWRLPFATLRDAEGQYLMERVTLFYAPSLAFLSRTPPSSSATPDSILSVGDPVVSGTMTSAVHATPAGFGPLPEAERESRRIASLYSHARVLVGADATEGAVKREAGRYGVLHFATHALDAPQQPLYSSVVLARDAEANDDGLLEAREILQLALRAELVVLSSCSSGRGAIRAGEGSIGLPWAFFAAGARRTVVALWTIDSAATEDAMYSFHRSFRRRGGASEAAAALREAQLRLQRSPNHSHPYYWGAFSVIGNAWPRVK